MSKLLSCPFCGNASPRLGGNDREGDMIICRAMDCGAVMYADDEETVITRWNTRAPAQAASEPEIDWLRARLNERDDFIVRRGLWSEFTDALLRIDAATSVSSTMQLCPDWRTCKCKDGCAHSSTDKPGEA